MRRLAALVLAPLALSATLAACGGGSSGSSGSSNKTPTSTTTPAAQERFNPDDWPVFGRDRDNTRYAPQTQINAKTVGRLGEAWSSDLGGDQYLMENFPIVVDGTMYVTTSTDEVYAFDAATGKVKWKYAPQVDFSLSTGVGGYGVTVNRGVAVSDGKVYLLTFDCQLKALSEATGEEVWSSRVTDPHGGAYETMSPTVYDGLVYVGNSGAEQGVRGFVAAYDAKTGKQRWRFYTVPAAGHDWVKPGNGGGTVYMAPTIDTKTGRVYVGTGNPSPTIVGTQRPGKNLYTASIVALDASTGKLVWYHQEVPHDLWDYDAASPVMIFDTEVNGKQVHAVAEAGKVGYLFMLDADTGADLFPRLAFVKQNHTPPTRKPTLECPGPLGGSQYAPLAYSPRVQAAYVSGIDFCFMLKVDDTPQHGESKFGGIRSFPSDVNPTGTFSAVSLKTGKFLWKRTMPTPMGGGAAVTAADLVFTGDQNGTLYAMDARTGATRWKANLGLAISSAPIVYSVKGTQYVAVSIGGSGLTSSKKLGPIGARVVVLKLGGAPISAARAHGG